MHTPLSVTLKRLQAFSELANGETEYSQNLIVGPGRHFEYGVPDTVELMTEPEPCGDALNSFLAALPDETLHSILALMYSGRDQVPNAIEYWKGLKSTFMSRKMCIEKIAEKKPRMQYIAAGIALLPKTIDLNGVPAAIATL